MDIGRCEQSGRALAWQSGVGFGGPWFGEYEQLGWLRNWGGGLSTSCGLDHALFGATDTARQYHYAAKQEETHGMHGRVSNRPAKLTAYGHRWDGDDCILYAEGEVLQAAVFGEHLLLRRRVEARGGANRFTIHDEIENVGWDPTPHIMLYHVNIGFPVVDQGSELLAPTKSVLALGDYPTDGYRSLDAPEADHYEQVYRHDPIGEADGSVPCGIINRAREFGAYEVFNVNQLPNHFIWRMLGEGTYVVGIEPCTNQPEDRLKMRKDGSLTILPPGEKRVYDLEFGALVGAAELDAFAARVSALGGI